MRFTEESVYHLLGIQHIDGKISRTDFFVAIQEELDFQHFILDNKMKKRFNDFKHRIRMFSCIYQVMRNQSLFYVNNGKIPGTSILADYVKYSLIDQKGVNIGIRLMDGCYVAYTLLVERSIHPTAVTEKLLPLKVKK